MRVVGEVMRIVTQTFLHLNIGWNGVSEEVDFRLNFPELSITAQKHHDVFSSNSDESGVFHVMGKKDNIWNLSRSVFTGLYNTVKKPLERDFTCRSFPYSQLEGDV